jgi:hypothetical protein
MVGSSTTARARSPSTPAAAGGARRDLEDVLVDISGDVIDIIRSLQL